MLVRECRIHCHEKFRSFSHFHVIFSEFDARIHRILHRLRIEALKKMIVAINAHMIDTFLTAMVCEGGSCVADFDPEQSHDMTLVYPVMDNVSDWNKATKQGVYLHVAYGPTVIKAMLDLSE